MSNKEVFEKLLRSTNRKGVEEVLTLLDTTDFYIAPASTRFHNSCEGGLLDHSINVAKAMCEEIPEQRDSAIITGLLHDVCKIGYYTVSYRNVKNETTGKWGKEPFYSVNDTFPYGHGEKSVLMLMQAGLELTTEEIMAIRWHMGAYTGQENWNTLSSAYENFPMALHLHIADMKATYLMEER